MRFYCVKNANMQLIWSSECDVYTKFDVYVFIIKGEAICYRFGLWCLMPLSTIFQLCRGSAECETILTDTMPGNK